MKLVTWNSCRGAYARKVALLEPLAPDVAVMQECARPLVQSDRCLWFGENPLQGIAVTVAEPYTIRALPAAANVPRFVFPVEVSGPESFTLLVVWSKGKQRSHPPGLNHSALVALLSELGLVSSYHHFFGEAHGAETRPTCYLLWKEARPYHIDYCFVPKEWATCIQNVEVGSYEAWKQYSDHRPLVVSIARPTP